MWKTALCCNHQYCLQSSQTAGYEYFCLFLLLQLNTYASSYYTLITDEESTNIRVLKDWTGSHDNMAIYKYKQMQLIQWSTISLPFILGSYTYWHMMAMWYLKSDVRYTGTLLITVWRSYTNRTFIHKLSIHLKNNQFVESVHGSHVERLMVLWNTSSWAKTLVFEYKLENNIIKFKFRFSFLVVY